MVQTGEESGCMLDGSGHHLRDRGLGGGDQERGMGRSWGDSLVSSLGHWVHGDAPGKHSGMEKGARERLEV